MTPSVQNNSELTVDNYFDEFSRVLNECLLDQDNRAALIKSIDLLKATRNTKSTIYLVGNGGSSAIAEHMAIDLTKNAGLKALAVSGSPMLTTFANDYGYERIYSKAIDSFGNKDDVLIAISSSGSSRNILNAVQSARAKSMKVITLSGFELDNPLRTLGDLNLWVNSRAFGYVELIHNSLLHYINDAIIGKAVYMIR